MDGAAINDLCVTLNSYHAPVILTILGGVLILVDYYFDTDIPAHFAYACFGFAAFLMGPPTFRESLLVGLLVWSVMLNFHFIFLREILARDLEEAPQT